MRNDEIKERWTRDGFVVIDQFLPPDQLDPAVSTLHSIFPTASEFHDGINPERNEPFRTEFGGIVDFPFNNVELSLLSVHSKLVELAEALLECDDIRAYAIEGWAKYTGAADYEQPLHRDYLNHTLLVPSDDIRFKQVEMFLYLCDVPDDLGPPSFVAREHTDGLPSLPNWYPPTDRPDDAPADESGWFASNGSPGLYDNEHSGAGRAGTLVVYTTSTFHRGRQLVQPRGARYTIHLNFRPANVEWATRRSWVEAALADGWSDFVERATPDQLALFGVPGPVTSTGHLRRSTESRLDTPTSTWLRGAKPPLALRTTSSGPRCVADSAKARALEKVQLLKPVHPREIVTYATADALGNARPGRPRSLCSAVRTAMIADVDRVDVVLANNDRVTLRVGDTFLKVDADQARADVEAEAIALAPVPTPEIRWRKPPVLALAALRGRTLGRLGAPSTASPEAWAAVGETVRALHDAPLPPWPGPSVDELATRLADECDWLITNNVLPHAVVDRNRRLAERVLRPWVPVFIHGDLHLEHVFVDGNAVTGIIDWSEARQGDALVDIASLTLSNEERLDDFLAGYGGDIDRKTVGAWWSWRCLVAVRWLVENGYGAPDQLPEVAVLRSQ